MPRVDNKGISIHYRVEGNGAPLVLGHGITDSSDVFYERGYVAALRPKYRLVLVDSRGHGQSDKPHDLQSYTSEKFASDIVAVLDALGMKTAAYWGYSMGGWVGFSLARHAPDRVARFVIGGRSATTRATEPGKDPPLMTALRGGPSEVIKAWGEEWIIPPLRERLVTNDMAALIACLQGWLDTKGFFDVLGTIAVPTLMMPELPIRCTMERGRLLPRYPAHNSCRYRIWSTQQRSAAATSFCLTLNRFWRTRPRSSVFDVPRRLWVKRYRSHSATLQAKSGMIRKRRLAVKMSPIAKGQ